MIPEQQELFAIALLRVLDANRTRFGLSVPALAHLVKPYGFTPDAQVTTNGLSYLEDKGLVTVINKTLHPEVRAWRLNAAGQDYLREHGY